MNYSHSQKLELNIFAIDSTSNIILQNIDFQKNHNTENSILSTLDSIKLEIERMGFFNYKLDSIIQNSPPTDLLSKKDDLTKSNILYTAHFNLKNQIQKIRVNYDDSIIKLNQRIAIDDKKSLVFFETTPELLPEKLYEISKMLENQGNSFSEVALKNISVKNDSIIEANLFIKKSILRKIDKIIINGYTNFPKTYLKHYLRLEKNTLFSKEKIDKASNAVNSIPFVSEIKPPEILFTKDSTIIYLYLKKENANKFDGLIGFTSKESGKGLSFNGYLDLSVNNLFDSGEHMNIVWKNNGNDRQVFNLDLSLPYFLNSKVSPHLALNIYKQDSSFVNTLFKLNLPYQINRRNSIGLSLLSESSSNLLSTLNNNIEDYNSTFIGLTYNYRIPNNHPLFRTKFNFISEALAGKRNGNIKNNQTKLFLKTNYLWSFNPKNHIFLQNSSGIINSDNFINNELLRIGGVNNIRGFDEESVLASKYSAFTIEYRHNTNTNSYFYSISDLGYVENNKISSQLYALGIGYAFSSKLGFINLSYASGGISKTPFNLNNSRFHIKITNIF